MNVRKLAMTLACLIPWAATALAGQTPAQAIEQGKAFGQANQPSTSNLNPASVPGYTTDNPPQTGYYNNPGAVEDAGIQALGNSQAGQTVTGALDQRPVFNLDPSSDPMIVNADQLSNSATQAATTPDGQIAAQYPGCTTTALNTTQDANASCSAWRTLRTETCERTLQIDFRIDRTCPSLTWFAQGETPITWHAYYQNWQTGRAGVRILCDEALAQQGQLRIQVWARGTRPPYAPSREFLIDTRPHDWDSPTGYYTYYGRRYVNPLMNTYWYWAFGSTGSLPGSLWFEERGGCDAQNQCRYEFRFRQWPWLLFWFGWYGGPSNYLSLADTRIVTLSFPKPGLKKTPVDRWVSSCATLEARTR